MGNFRAPEGKSVADMLPELVEKQLAASLADTDAFVREVDAGKVAEPQHIYALTGLFVLDPAARSSSWTTS